MINTEQLSHIQTSLHSSLHQFSTFYQHATHLDNATRINNQLIIPNFLNIFLKHSMTTLQSLLQFLEDSDIMNMGATCRPVYRILYSPLGFRLITAVRPIIYRKDPNSSNSKKAEDITDDEIPYFSQNTVDQLCSDRSLESADQDDKMAILLTMRTNILATKQKVRQLDLMISAYEKKSDIFLTRIMYIGGQREEECRKISTAQDEIQKLKELLKATDGHHDSLREEQERLMLDRQQRLLMLNEDKSKLDRQKELLIKKIKSQQKEKEEGMVYAREVDRVLGRLNNLTERTSRKEKE